jgi:hypothetical protein
MNWSYCVMRKERTNCFSPPYPAHPLHHRPRRLPLMFSDAIQRIAFSAAVRAAGPRAGSASDMPAYAAGAPGAVTPSGISAGFPATASCHPANAVDFTRLYNRLYMVS